MDLQKFRERLIDYRRRAGISQEIIADAIYINKSVLSEMLNGKRPFTPGLIHRIVQFLAKEEAILGRSQAYELLKLTDTEDFSEADWNAPPLANLAPEVSPHRHHQREVSSEVTASEEITPAQNVKVPESDNEPQANSLAQIEEQTITTTQTSMEQEQLFGKNAAHPQVFSAQLPYSQSFLSSPKDRLEAAYRQIIGISEARFKFAGTVETLRKLNGGVAHEDLPKVKRELEDAEAAFQEQEVVQTLRLLDNNKVWPHYVLGTAAYEKHKERTKDLVRKALDTQSPLMRPVFNIDALLAGDRWKDNDPQTRKLYEEMDREFNAMIRAMNKRLRL